MLFPDAFPRSQDEDSGLFAERYELGKLLRRGPFGTTFAALDTSQEHRPCEVQVLDHARDLEALRELRAQLASLPSRYRLPLRASGKTEEGKLYWEWDALPCETLTARLERSRPLPPRHGLEIARQILACLTEAHGRGLAHGSIGPDSVLLEEEPRWSEDTSLSIAVRLTDFGLRTLGGNPIATEYDEEGDPFADDRLAVMRLLAQATSRKSASVRQLLERFEAGAYPTAGFLLSAVEEAQRKSNASRRLRWNVLVPALAVLLFGALFLRERSASSAARTELDAKAAELSVALERHDTDRARWEVAAKALEGEADLSLDARIERRWNAITARPGESDVEELAALARWFDDGRLEDALTGYANALERHLEGGGHLAPRFDAFPNLRAWSETIAADPALSMSEAGARILVLEHGRRLASADGTPPPLPPLVRARLPKPASPAIAEILRRSRLSETFPGPRGVLRIYREENPSRFVSERVVDPRQGRVERRVHAADGTFLEAQEIADDHPATRWHEADRWERLQLADEPADELPLEALGIDVTRYQRFRRAFEGRPLEVLRTVADEEAGTALLLSPELGELRREGNLERELVFADLLP